MIEPEFSNEPNLDLSERRHRSVSASGLKALPPLGVNVTGLTNLTTELAGKRLELLKEAVPKVARVAILYDPGSRPGVRDVKEILPVAARALELTVRSWEVRDADGFERVFAELSKWCPAGIYVPSGGPLMFANEKRTAGLR